MKPKDLNELTLPQLISKIISIKLRIAEHKRLQNLYGGDYIWRDKQITINRNINRLQKEMYHYVIRRNVLLKKQLEWDRECAYYNRRALGIPARYKK